MEHLLQRLNGVNAPCR